VGAVRGRVFLVGAGPGAADLITLRGARAIRDAEVLLCDELLPRSFLDDLGVSLAGKTVHWLGDGAAHRSQSEINGLISRAALSGKPVARIKTGDPHVFGRGAEEAEHLASLGIPCEVISGLSSCLAAPAVAGLSLTRRGQGRSFAVATARTAGGGISGGFPRADSLVILMGAAVLEEISSRLIRDGWPPATPAALVERATQPWERRAAGRLESIAAVARSAGILSPAVLVVGAAADVPAETPRRPRVLFTGLDPTNFRTLGDIVHWPALRLVADPEGRARLPEALRELREGMFEWVVFTSRVGARSFLAALDDAGLDARVLAGARISAAGAGTAAELREGGLLADAVPSEAGSRGIVGALGEAAGAAHGVLLVQGSHAPGDLVSALKARGWPVVRLSLHRVVPHPGLGRPLPEHDVVYFVSPSAVRAFHAAYGEAGFRGELWCIGEVTRKALVLLKEDGKVVDPHGS